MIRLVFKDKKLFKDNLVFEAKIWIIEDGDRYPDNIKYKLIMIEPKSGKRILFDNHPPKGHHYHIDVSYSSQKQFSYNFETPEKLRRDFTDLVLKHFGVSL